MNTEHEREAELAKRIEAGLLAQDILDGATNRVGASMDELEALAEQGRQAKDELVMANIGLVTIIAAEAARARRVAFNDLFQEGCLAMQQAVMSYDWRKGTFGSYAGMWVRANVRRFPSRNWVPLELVEVEDAANTAALDQSAIREGLARALDRIPDGERRVLQLRTGWDGDPQTRENIASGMGLTLSKVRTLERRGIQYLRAQWQLAQAA